MTEELSLRERKKMQTGRAIWMAAITLFTERGFDAVSVKEIADAAEVSKMTVFNYFPTKEDLVMRPMSQHVGDPARVVRDRAPGMTPHAAVREHFLAALGAFDPSTGLNDSPEVLAVQRMIRETPALLMRALAYNVDSQRLLAEQLVAEGADAADARIVAAQIVETRDTLISINHESVTTGRRTAEEALPEAVRNAGTAFGLLEHGLGDLYRRK